MICLHAEKKEHLVFGGYNVFVELHIVTRGVRQHNADHKQRDQVPRESDFEQRKYERARG